LGGEYILTPSPLHTTIIEAPKNHKTKIFAGEVFNKIRAPPTLGLKLSPFIQPTPIKKLGAKSVPPPLLGVKKKV